MPFQPLNQLPGLTATKHQQSASKKQSSASCITPIPQRNNVCRMRRCQNRTVRRKCNPFHLWQQTVGFMVADGLIQFSSGSDLAKLLALNLRQQPAGCNMQQRNGAIVASGNQSITIWTARTSENVVKSVCHQRK